MSIGSKVKQLAKINKARKITLNAGESVKVDAGYQTFTVASYTVNGMLMVDGLFYVVNYLPN